MVTKWQMASAGIARECWQEERSMNASNADADLGDVLAIRDLFERSSDLINHQEWAALEALFTEDAVWEMLPPTPARRPGPCRGPNSARSWRSPRPAACIATTSDAPPELAACTHLTRVARATVRRRGSPSPCARGHQCTPPSYLWSPPVPFRSCATAFSGRTARRARESVRQAAPYSPHPGPRRSVKRYPELICGYATCRSGIAVQLSEGPLFGPRKRGLFALPA